jgi:hypothetical protein
MWHRDESGRVHTPFEPVVLAATLSLIPVLIIERTRSPTPGKRSRRSRTRSSGPSSWSSWLPCSSRETEVGRAASALARHRAHDPHPRQGACVAAACSLHPPCSLRGHHQSRPAGRAPRPEPEDGGLRQTADRKPPRAAAQPPDGVPSGCSGPCNTRVFASRLTASSAEATVKRSRRS